MALVVNQTEFSELIHERIKIFFYFPDKHISRLCDKILLANRLRVSEIEH